MRNVAALGVTKRYTAAKIWHWEAGLFCKGSKARTRYHAKRELARAIRRSEKAHIADSLGG